MQDLRDLLRADAARLPQERAVALLTLVGADGQTHHRTATRMLVGEDGYWAGSGRSGYLEVPALERIQAVLATARPGLITVDTAEEDLREFGLGLARSGVLSILVHPLQEEVNRYPLRLLRELLAADEDTQVLVTVTRSAQAAVPLGAMYRFTDEAGFRQTFPVKGAALDHLVEKIRFHRGNYRSKYLDLTEQGGDFAVYIEIFPPRLRLYLFGANHDAQLLLRMAKLLGWYVGVVAPDTEVNRAVYAAADAWYDPDGALPPADARSAAVLIHHDRAADSAQLRRLLATELPYIGLLGPQRRQTAILDDLRTTVPDLDGQLAGRFFGPIGLDVGATGPGEIALAILAEIRAFFAGQPGGFLRGREGAVHG
jgi:xanthine/CO dehydrogenase XdhC/CoxF family maturation factor